MSEQAAALLTASEVATMLRCHVDTVRRAIDRGDIRAVRVGGRYLIARAVVDEIIARATGAATSAHTTAFGWSPR